MNGSALRGSALVDSVLNILHGFDNASRGLSGCGFSGGSCPLALSLWKSVCLAGESGAKTGLKLRALPICFGLFRAAALGESAFDR